MTCFLKNMHIIFLFLEGGRREKGERNTEGLPLSHVPDRDQAPNPVCALTGN